VDRTDGLQDVITRVNAYRRAHPALHRNESLRFHEIDDDHLIAYSKQDADSGDVALIVVNLDPHHARGGSLRLPLEELGLSPREPFQAHDELTDVRYLWQGPVNYVELDPATSPAHLFTLRRRIRSERDFEYFM
jgi:starch synthase (maltosyl-transferring)